MNLRLRNALPAASDRIRRRELEFQLVEVLFAFGSRALERVGDALSSTLLIASVFFHRKSVEVGRFRGRFNSSSRSKARGFFAAVRSRNHHARAANIPNTAQGTMSCIVNRSARITVGHTLMLTILRITRAPSTLENNGSSSSFFPMGSENSTMM